MQISSTARPQPAGQQVRTAQCTASTTVRTGMLVLSGSLPSLHPQGRIRKRIIRDEVVQCSHHNCTALDLFLSGPVIIY